MSERAKQVVLDRHDLKLLSILSETVYEFPKTAAQENRLCYLHEHGLVRRKWDLYSRSRNVDDYRWSYRISKAGIAALKAGAK